LFFSISLLVLCLKIRYKEGLFRGGILSVLLVRFLIVLVGLVVAMTTAFAMDSTQTLPAKVNSPSFRMGSVSNVGQRFNDKGELLTLNDLKSVEFNVRTLSQLEPQVNQLVSALNSFGTASDRYGDRLSLGVLKIDVEPQVSYFAPVHAWGINEFWTIGFGVPVITYKAKFSLRQEGSNLEEYRRQFEGRVSPELDSAFARLSVSLPEATQSQLEQKGYERLGDRNKTFIGDIPVVSIYRFYDNDRWVFAHRGTLSLPTGPKDNPDDLMDMGGFGLLSLSNEVLSTYKFGKSWDFNARGGIKYVLPDQVEKRVPRDNGDMLPDSDRKERVTRYTSPTGLAGASANYKFNREWSTGLGYEFSAKERDRIDGKQSGAYAVLENETNSVAHRSRAELSYSTVQAYLDKSSLIPTTFSLEISDIFAGQNVPRQTLTELTWLLFY
jgi:opacity protein-like surface antigen